MFESVFLLDMIEAWKTFIASNLPRRWYRVIAFPFRPRKDLADAALEERVVGAAYFVGSCCFWLLAGAGVLILVTGIYDHQLFGLDIPLLILMGLCVAFAIIAFATALYLLLADRPRR
jgi:hypothetical protein